MVRSANFFRPLVNRPFPVGLCLVLIDRRGRRLLQQNTGRPKHRYRFSILQVRIEQCGRASARKSFAAWMARWTYFPYRRIHAHPDGPACRCSRKTWTSIGANTRGRPEACDGMAKLIAACALPTRLWRMAKEDRYWPGGLRQARTGAFFLTFRSNMPRPKRPRVFFLMPIEPR